MKKLEEEARKERVTLYRYYRKKKSVKRRKNLKCITEKKTNL